MRIIILLGRAIGDLNCRFFFFTFVSSSNKRRATAAAVVHPNRNNVKRERRLPRVPFTHTQDRKDQVYVTTHRHGHRSTTIL